MVDRILASIDLLKVFPHRYAIEFSYRGLPKQVRSLPVQPYVVYFRVLDRERVVRILTIRHGARRRPRRFA